MSVRRAIAGFFRFKTAAVLLHAGFSLAVATLVLKAVLPGEKGDVGLVPGEAVEIADDVLVLKDFDIARYSSGKPKQFTSSVHVVSPDGKRAVHADISVNHPLVYRGWWIYQTSYDEDNPSWTCLTAFRDPWLPLAGIAGLALLLGAVVLVVRPFPPSRSACTLRTRAGRIALALCALALTGLPVFFIGRACFRPELMPALQSPLLFPHVLAYLLSYIVLLFAAFGFLHRLVPAAFALMTVGLVLGAVWGKICWGDWWQYDPKEMWSLATWLVYAGYFHFRGRVSVRAERIWLAVGAGLVVLTLTWVNLSRFWSGVHSYA